MNHNFTNLSDNRFKKIWKYWMNQLQYNYAVCCKGLGLLDNPFIFYHKHVLNNSGEPHTKSQDIKIP